MVILLIGPPASGKGTIGKMLSQYLGLSLVSLGKILREIPQDSLWHEPIRQAMDQGELASNSILGGFLTEIVKDSRYESGYVLDGWLRQMSDLEFFDPKPDLVLFLNVSFETSLERTLSRRICEQGGHTYNLISNPPQKEGICDVDGSRLVSRDDDTEEVLKHRWQIFTQRTVEVIEHYKAKGVVKEISAEGTPESIFKQVKDKML